ncbi:dioxygenase [Aquabacterium sp.]|uniref:dioxygenase family protein n=1 Tax=Aquabacterium sp. TaxID=1872578 RepID=UPI0025BCD909|nr:dioxygenase [Aquabacterium sp.]
MKNEMNQAELLARVNTSHQGGGSERVRAISARIVGDLFKAIDDLDIQPDEFWAGVDWISRLGASGQAGLITAGLGFDRLLDIRQDEADERAGLAKGTPRAIEGPLYVAGAPSFKGEVVLDEGADLKGDVFVMEGQVLDTHGKPVPHALVDVWHANDHGRYSHFDPAQPAYNLRRRIETDAQGRYRFRSCLPPGYAIPPNSPTSELFTALGRHGNRPAHVHFLVAAPGLRALTTQVNISGDPFIHDDFAFATRDDLIVEVQKGVSPAGYESLGLTQPFGLVRFNFTLQPARDEDESAPKSRMARALG